MSALEAALLLANAGIPVFPCGADKAPLVAGGFKAASSDPTQVELWWRDWPDALIGVPTGSPSGLFAVDVDVDDKTAAEPSVAVGRASLRACGINGHAHRVRTRSGGWHLFYRWHADLPGNSARKLAGVDVRGQGGYVIAWDPNALLRAHGTEDLRAPPWALIEALTRKPDRPRPEPSGEPFAAGEAWAEAALAGEIADVRAAVEGRRNDALNRAAFCLGQIVAGGHLGAGRVEAKLLAAAEAAGLHHIEAGKTIASGMAAGASEPRAPKDGGRRADPGTRPGAVDKAQDEAAEPLVVDKRGRPIWNAANADVTLATHPDWADVLAYDEVAVACMVLRPIPGSKTPRSTFRPRPLTDTDLHNALAWFCRHGFPHATKVTSNDAVLAACAGTPLNPVRDYLEGVKWDGIPRLDTWLTNYCGAPDGEYISAVGRKWMVSAIARALMPGSQCDYLLVLEGEQGIGKSEVLRTLAGRWFGDALPDLRNKDASSYLRGKWIIEISELAAMRRAEIEHVKAFLTRREENYRPAYGRTEAFEPRRCVFAGTTNRGDYLKDDTGNRRFWPVACGVIDLEALARDRDQLWAEAVSAFKNGETWFLDGAREQMAGAEQAARQPDDPWLTAAGEYLSDKANEMERKAATIPAKD